MWKFNPILKTTIWGGDRIIPFKHLDATIENVGESWEISAVEGDESIVANGPDKGLSLPELIVKYNSSLMGSQNFARFGTRFPLLVKFIDARQDLSVQVHPDDEMAQKYGEPNGKTEMWHILDSAPGGRLANGFKQEVDPADYNRLVETGEIEQVLNFVEVAPGDTFFIPAGRVHAIGAGCFVAEIQQTSDATYRLYDYRRRDAEGNLRQLHTEKGFEATNFSDTDGNAIKYNNIENLPVNLVRTRFFTTNVLNADTEITRDYSEIDSFIIIIATAGSGRLRCGSEEMDVRQGESILIPASAERLTILPSPTMTLLEAYV